ncbi:putative two-component response regulator-like APRR4 [Eutrema salsugineum]|uniref:putative two-component response regulator-like APRR4 n=1 Tax=Eutrema salsugineum TaxID=72664 RepID=UPI000CED4C14|nr:putative two-component response regulator-like APRR4 [Eutrema salsugineum]
MAEQRDGGGPSRYHPNSSDMFSGMYPENKFPEGLRVLLFDQDPQYLLALEQHLKAFQYEVTRCNEEERARYLLHHHRIRFDIAIIEAQNVDRFRFISEMDLPIIIISKDDSVESVIKWMNIGACDYLIKPIRPEDLRLIFKHVAKKVQVRRNVVVAGEAEEKTETENSSSVRDPTVRNRNKRKKNIFLEGQENEEGHDPTTKKRRVVWDDELHKKFIKAVEYLGTGKAVPKRILEMMNVNGITRENVASHLQVTFFYYTLNICFFKIKITKS